MTFLIGAKDIKRAREINFIKGSLTAAIILLSLVIVPLLCCLADQSSPDKRSLMRYRPGDVVSVLVESPLDVDSVVAVMPNNESINLTNDTSARAWHGAWRVPKDLAPGVFRAKVVAVDYQGIAITSSSEPFMIEAVPQNIAYDEGGKQPERAITTTLERPTSIEASAGTSEASGWYKVRVGLFPDERSATLLAYELRAQGYDAFEVLQMDLWSVQVGAFRDRDNAFNLYTEFRRKGYFAAILVTDL